MSELTNVDRQGGSGSTEAGSQYDSRGHNQDCGGSAMPRVSNPIVSQMLDVIERSFARPITLYTLAAALNRQASYLGHLFRQAVGMTVRERLTRVRLQHAAHFLREGKTVDQVSVMVGYRSKKNFYRRFRRAFGCTPFEYRLREGSQERVTNTNSVRTESDQ